LRVLATGALLLVAAARSASSQQRSTPIVIIRMGSALHVAGLELSNISRPDRRGSGPLWQHRVQPARAMGLSVAIPYRSGLFGVRFDTDFVPGASIRGDQRGPPLINSASGRSYWTTASVALSPTVLCEWRCVQLGVGAGRGFYDYSVGELRGDIGNFLAPKQHVTVYRFGAEARARLMGLPIALLVADYVGSIAPGYADSEQLSPMHTLVISAGLVLGR
jgi:hypothetical protein